MEAQKPETCLNLENLKNKTYATPKTRKPIECCTGNPLKPGNLLKPIKAHRERNQVSYLFPSSATRKNRTPDGRLHKNLKAAKPLSLIHI